MADSEFARTMSSAAATASDADLQSMMARLLSSLNDPRKQAIVLRSAVDAAPRELRAAVVRDALTSATPGEAADTVTDAVRDLPREQREAVIAKVSGMGLPSDRTRDRLWGLIVAAFCIVFVGTFLVLAIAVFTEKPKESRVSPELIMAMFTTVVGFLTGLLAPSPVAPANRSPT